MSETTGAVNSVREHKIYTPILITILIDSGATVNVFLAKYVNKEDIQPNKPVLQMWNKTELKLEGTCRMTIRNPRNQVTF